MAKRSRIAIINIGSISVRLKIYEVVTKEAPKELESVRRFLALGAYSYRFGSLSPELTGELCQILQDFSQKLKEYKLDSATCIATSALREAQNKDFILEQIRLRTGFVVTIIDNALERYYHNIAVKELMEDFDQIQQAGTLLLDIGAGSIQSTVYDKGSFVFSQNMLLGSLRIRELLTDFERQTTDYAKVLDEFISHDLEDYYALEPKGLTYQNFIAFGSDMGFIKSIAGFSPREYCFISREKFMQTFAYLKKTSPSELILNHNIPSASAGLLLPIALIIKTSLDYSGVKGIHLPAISLCEGFIYNWAHKNTGYGLKFDPTVDTLSAARHVGKRYRYDKKHGDYVEGAALAIFDAAKKYHGMNKRQRLLLQLAAILHEVGKYINVSHHNIRSYNIIHTTEIIGLEREEQEIIAYVARFYNTDDLYKDRYYQYLDREQRKVIAKLTAILQLADSLDASHRQKGQRLVVTCLADSITLSVFSQENMAFEEWAFAKRCDFYQQVFGSLPVLKIRRGAQ